MDDEKNKKLVDRARKAFDFIFTMRKGGQVKRFHTEQIIGEETVGHHTYGVITWVLALTDRAASKELMLSALYHDTDEQVMGDLPGPVKWDWGDLDNLTEQVRNSFRLEYKMHVDLTMSEHLTLRWADKMDLLMTCVDQQRLGNIRGIEIGRKVVCRLESYAVHPIGSEMLKMFLHRHPEYNSDQIVKGAYYE